MCIRRHEERYFRAPNKVNSNRLKMSNITAKEYKFLSLEHTEKYFINLCCTPWLHVDVCKAAVMLFCVMHFL